MLPSPKCGEIARRTAVAYQTVCDWINGRSRAIPTIRKTTITETFEHGLTP